MSIQKQKELVISSCSSPEGYFEINMATEKRICKIPYFWSFKKNVAFV